MNVAYSKEIQTVFRWFGIAAHNIQVFEADLISLMLLLTYKKGSSAESMGK